MVCLGNICRSPLAEGILKSKLDSDLFFIDSAGTSAYHIGQLPDPRSINVAKKYGIDITNQRARKFTSNDFSKFDYIYAMDKQNYQNILSLASNETEVNKVNIILSESYTQKNQCVPDPYYDTEHGFEKVYHLLDEVCDLIAKKIMIQ
tara:strand:+ start:4543 stop:4986 length:444 start_codon:yes stop_codon:yes gene_type:complete